MSRSWAAGNIRAWCRLRALIGLGFTASRLRPVVDGRPTTYFDVSPPRALPGGLRLHCWDDPSTGHVPGKLRHRIRDAAARR